MRQWDNENAVAEPLWQAHSEHAGGARCVFSGIRKEWNWRNLDGLKLASLRPEGQIEANPLECKGNYIATSDDMKLVHNQLTSKVDGGITGSGLSWSTLA